MAPNITETVQLLDELNALMSINMKERARLQNILAGHSSAGNAVFPDIQTSEFRQFGEMLEKKQTLAIKKESQYTKGKAIF